MSIGLTNAPVAFQVVINNALHKYIDVFIITYLNNMLVYSSRTLAKHEEHVKKVLQMLLEYRLLIQLDKCKFNKDIVEFLGFIISRNSITIDLLKTKAIIEQPTPIIVKEVQLFLSFINFYQKFVIGYSSITTRLFKLIKKDQVQSQDKKTQEVF